MTPRFTIPGVRHLWSRVAAHGVLGCLLAVMLAAPLAGSVAASTQTVNLPNNMQWEFVTADGSQVISGGELISIRNIRADAVYPDNAPHFLVYTVRDWGINMDFTERAPKNVMIVRKPGLDPKGVIKSGETVALRIKGVPGQASGTTGYLTYGERPYGINLKWAKSPQYSWKLSSLNPGPHGELVAGPGGLYNSTPSFRTDKNGDGKKDVGDYVGYGRRAYGINLWWENHHSSADGCHESFWKQLATMVPKVAALVYPESAPVGAGVIYVVNKEFGGAIVCD